MISDMTLMHLMCTKICHDLAAPVSAVTMGLEMLSQDSQNTSVYNLIHSSSQSTVSKLETFRCLTGFAGMENSPTGESLEKALRHYWPDHKISLEWGMSDLKNIQGPVVRLLLAIILVAAEGLPQGGILTIGADLRLIAQGPKAYLNEDVVQTLLGNMSVSQQTSRTIIAFFAHTLAHNLNKLIDIDTKDENQFQMIMS